MPVFKCGSLTPFGMVILLVLLIAAPFPQVVNNCSSTSVTGKLLRCQFFAGWDVRRGVTNVDSGKRWGIQI